MGQGGKMDKILRHAQAHGEIFEALSFFNKAMSVTAGEKTIDYLHDISKLFSKDIISHLKFEEGRIFSLVLSDGSLKDKGFIRSLQHEHIDILAKIDEFNDLLPKGNFESSDKNKVKGLVELSKEIIKMMLTHARKEDGELFPLLKRLGYSIAETKVN